MRKSYDRLGKIELAFCAVLLMCIVLLVFTSIWARFIKMPLIWTIDISQLMFAWITFVGADVAYRRGKFIGVDILVKKFPPIILRSINVLIDVIILITCLFLIKNGYDLTMGNLMRRFQTLPITYAWVNASLPVGCAFLSITALMRVYTGAKNMFAKNNK